METFSGIFEFQIDEKPNGMVLRLNNEKGICALRICKIPKELVINQDGSIREFIDIEYPSGVVNTLHINKLSWIEKDRLAGIRLSEMKALATQNSVLNEVSDKILRQIIIEGINIGLKYGK